MNIAGFPVKAAAIAKLPVLTGKALSDADTLSKTGTTDSHPFELPPPSLPMDTSGNIGNYSSPTGRAGEISSKYLESVDRLGDRNAPDFDGFHWTYKNEGDNEYKGGRTIQKFLKPLENPLNVSIITPQNQARRDAGVVERAGFENQ